jgi:hypothetical protein
MCLRLKARKLAPRKKQHCTNEGDQRPPCVCLRYNWDVVIPIAVASALFVAIAIVISIMIAFGVG